MNLPLLSLLTACLHTGMESLTGVEWIRWCFLEIIIPPWNHNVSPPASLLCFFFVLFYFGFFTVIADILDTRFDRWDDNMIFDGFEVVKDGACVVCKCHRPSRHYTLSLIIAVSFHCQLFWGLSRQSYLDITQTNRSSHMNTLVHTHQLDDIISSIP